MCNSSLLMLVTDGVTIMIVSWVYQLTWELSPCTPERRDIWLISWGYTYIQTELVNVWDSLSVIFCCPRKTKLGLDLWRCALSSILKYWVNIWFKFLQVLRVARTVFYSLKYVGSVLFQNESRCDGLDQLTLLAGWENKELTKISG